MSLVIPDEIVKATGMSEGELKKEIAVHLFEKERLTLGQAASLATMDYLQFQHLLASREIPLHYDLDEFEDDLDTLKKLGRL
jgi:predicted HTH domain antitoxin